VHGDKFELRNALHCHTPTVSHNAMRVPAKHIAIGLLIVLSSCINRNSIDKNDDNISEIPMIFNIIPTNPDYTVSQEQLIEIEKYLAISFPTKDIKVKQHDSIQFVDCGEKFEKVICGHCHDMIDIELWQEWMTKSYETGFKDRTIKMQCCVDTSALDKLIYEHPQGFARLIIQIDSMTDDEMSIQTFANLQEFKVGAPIWIIKAKY
jgi:hypothetical protein